MKAEKNVIALLSVLMAVVLVGSTGSLAGPTPPGVSGSIATFTGDQSLGIWPTSSWNCPPVYTFNVNSLTTDITPAAGVPGIELFRSGVNGTDGAYVGSGSASPDKADDGGPGGLGGEIGPWPDLTVSSPAVDFIGGSYEIETSGVNAFGIGAVSTGGTGGNGGTRVGFWEIFTANAGHGGAGGWGLPVTVTSDGTIRTDGSSSDGILARSEGGDGGDGGHAQTTAWPANAGNGGAGGVAWSGTVTSYGSITTNGDDSPGIRVLSQGGDGGDGGDAKATSTAVAGAGGAGGMSRDATVTNYAGIQTRGTGSPGIYALSDGGDGGDGGDALGSGASAGNGGPGAGSGVVSVENHGNIQTAGDSADGIITASLGGAGGSGGSASGALFGNSGIALGTGPGGAVEVTNTGDILASGTDVRGIFAQSIGGFFGDAGGAMGLVGLAGWGGSSDSGGHGGSVTVTNSGAVTTTGSNSERIGGAIVAKSIGGGGGDAGLVAGMITIGGDGSAGGNGGDVTVENSGPLQTSGRNANGILAESIGGGGGDGASSVNAGLEVSVGLGGKGESGGDGGNVSVDSEATSITTAGDLSHGIQAQSVGGGGGNGGSVVSYTAGFQFAAGLSLGGNAGDGGDGGQVNLTSASQITTQGEHAHGLYAESVGGGGGSGGNALVETLAIGLPNPVGLPSISTSISMGGSGGAGGSGQAVTVSSTGDIDTSALGSYGILAQSVGGGGGYAGNSMAGNKAFNSYTATIAVGGSGDIGGSGDAVQVTSGGNIATQGDFAYGILGQSIGGGGGVAGNSKTLVTDIDIPIGLSLSDFVQSLISPDLNFTLSLGGQAGGGGDGGAVDIISTGHIDTQGEFAHGILAQSVGGGGGTGGDSTNVDTELIPDVSLPLDFLNVGGKVLLGGSGGAGGQGGVVNVESQGNISTEGNFANGILAQSIGGGGGAGGSIHDDFYGFTKPESSMELGIAVGGNGGDGGDVTVENSGDITTHGGFAHGILAQSIGGGGGFGGISEDFGWSILQGFLYNGVSAQNTGFGVGFAGSAGGLGSAGAVDVTHTGSITTLGDMSHGILAQSAAGSGTAGPVTVTLASDITVNGMNSDGIHAQSVGIGGNGDISINIGGGTVQGGSGTGAGVNIDGGANNTLANASSVLALSGKAIMAGIGNDIVENYGTVTGNVDLGTGANAFNNNPGATFNSGAIVNLGESNVLTNAGTLSPGGLGTALQTTLMGDLAQLESGILDIEIGGFTPGSFDFIDVTGTVTGGMAATGTPLLMGGTINFSFLSGYDIAAEIALGQSMTCQFLNAGYLDGFASTLSYDFLGSPGGFQYSVFQQDNGLFLRATNSIPAPGALLLGCFGLALVGWRGRRARL